jgi:signal recognition particle receptor subunit beta
MAELDRETGRLLVRIAFDGPPLAGKTATLRGLGGLLDVPVESMDEAYGRTLWFDWMRYVGGLYDGQPIDCEVVSVPGQDGLHRRRDRLLDQADAVVFVVDASPLGRDTSVKAWGRFAAWRAGRGRPPGLVVQANKRDLADAWNSEEVRRALALPPDVAVVESVATSSTGVRRAFVLAVREAIRVADRARQEQGVIATSDGLRSADQLLKQVQGEISDAPDSHDPTSHRRSGWSGRSVVLNLQRRVRP